MPALTSLRFVAALLVVLFHLTVWRPGLITVPGGRGLRHLVSQAFFNVSQTGPEAVSFFFVLSGFILTYTYLSSHSRVRGGLRSFYVARIARILPVYALALVVAVPLVTWGTLRHPLLVGIATPTMTQGWLSWDWTAWDPPAWSLSCEAFFYALFPLFAVPLARITQRKRLAVVLVELWLFSLATPSLALLLHLSASDQLTATQRIPLGRLPEFLMGVVIARLVALTPETERRMSRRRSLLTSATVLVLGAVTLVVAANLPFPYTMGGTIGPVAASVILILAMARDPLVAFLGSAPLVGLGEASYALYLLHDPIWSWLDRRMHVAPAGGMSCILFFIAYLIALVALSLLVVRFIEQPARRAIRRRFA